MDQNQHNAAEQSAAGSWIRFAWIAGTLLVIWVLLSGKLDALHLGLGVLTSLVIAASFHRRLRERTFPLWRFLGFLPWQMWQIFLSNLRVTRAAMLPGDQIQPSFIERDPLVRSDEALTLLGCGITLTPGTLTVEIEPGHCLVHALDDVSAGDIEADVMAKRVAQVFCEPIEPGDETGGGGGG